MVREDAKINTPFKVLISSWAPLAGCNFAAEGSNLKQGPKYILSNICFITLPLLKVTFFLPVNIQKIQTRLTLPIKCWLATKVVVFKYGPGQTPAPHVSLDYFWQDRELCARHLCERDNSSWAVCVVAGSPAASHSSSLNPPAGCPSTGRHPGGRPGLLIAEVILDAGQEQLDQDGFSMSWRGLLCNPIPFLFCFNFFVQIGEKAEFLNKSAQKRWEISFDK